MAVRTVKLSREESERMFEEGKIDSFSGIRIYADGACSGNPGKGGYGALIISEDREERELQGEEFRTTNNRMELMAVIIALESISEPSRIEVVSDSRYVIDGITKWVPGWIERNWKNSKKKNVLNRDLWERLIEAAKPHKVKWVWVNGHQGYREQERADELAREATRKPYGYIEE